MGLGSIGVQVWSNLALPECCIIRDFKARFGLGLGSYSFRRTGLIIFGVSRTQARKKRHTPAAYIATLNSKCLIIIAPPECQPTS